MKDYTDGAPTVELPAFVPTSAPFPRQWTIYLPGKWPSLNALNTAKANAHAYHKIKMAWQNPATLIIKSKRIPRLACVWLSYTHHRKDKRSDKSNLAAAAAKIIEDALVDAGVIQDDGWNFISGFEHRFESADRDGVTLVVRESTQ